MSALIHTANRDYKSLIEDLVALEVLPADTDRGQVENMFPLMTSSFQTDVVEGAVERFGADMSGLSGR